MNSKKNPLDKLLYRKEDLKVVEELIGLHAMNSFINHCSSARGTMMSSHFSQSLVLNDGEEKIIQTGLEKQFGDNTFAKKPEEDVRIVKIIDRYNSVEYNGINAIVEKTFIVESLETGEIDYIDVPYYNKLHQYFGFKYNINPDIDKFKVGDILPKGYILADSPSVGKNKGYMYGVNGNLALINIPETTEDGVVISKSFAEKLNYTIFESRVVEFGANYFPLNIYGDDNNYKPFPDIGELVNQDSVIMALREYNERLSPALTSINDVRDFDPLFDKVTYVKAPGEEKLMKDFKHGGYKKVNYGKVVDIKVWSTPKSSKKVYTGVAEMFNKYVEGYKKYYTDLLRVYDELSYDKLRNKQVKKEVLLSDRLHRLIIEAMSIANPNNDKITYKNRNELLDLYRIEFVIEYTCTANIGSKVSDSHGAKGVIVELWDDEDMPHSLDGKVRADIIMDPASVVSRLNVSRVYEQYFGAVSRRCQELIRNTVGIKQAKEYTKQELDKGMEILLGLLKIIGNEQYDTYASVTDVESKREIISECVHKEVYILFRISNKKPAYIIYNEIKGTIYEPVFGPVRFKSEDEIKTTKENVLIAPTYNILLNKVANSAISTSSSKLNHYGLPVSVNNSAKNLLPYKESSLKNISETENRLFISYGGRKAAAELKDRAVSLPTHTAIYKNILNADVPTNIEDVVGRDVNDYTGDAAMDIVNNIVNCAGISIDYVDDPDRVKEK